MVEGVIGTNRQINAAKLTFETTFFVTQRMLDSLQILQMDRLTLEDYIAEQLQENPVLNYPDISFNKYILNANENDNRGQRDVAQHTNHYDTLEFFLTDQLERLNIADRTKWFCKRLIALIDRNGYLPMSHLPDSYANDREFQKALSVLQSLDPAGVAARDLKECLLLQLHRLEERDHLAETLVSNHLEDLSRRNMAKIQKTTGASIEDLQKSLQSILTLNPRPGADFAKREETVYILPDFKVSCDDGRLILQQEEQAFPLLTISDYYIELYETTQDPEVKRYLKERIANAKNFITGLENRKSTVLRCIEAILQVQQIFFVNQSRQLVPMTQQEVARMVDLHTSTVSRAIRGKHLEFDGKIYPLKYFFARGLNNTDERIATDQIRELIRQIVQNENLEHPLSDQQIVHILQQGGADVSRRTVAKYREQMGILSSKQRRKI